MLGRAFSNLLSGDLSAIQCSLNSFVRAYNPAVPRVRKH